MKHSGHARRRRLRDERAALSSGTQRESAEAITSKVSEAVAERFPKNNVGVVAGYVATAGEIDPAPALEALRSNGWRLALPVCGPEATMEFCPWTPGDTLAPNRYGIGEPQTEALALEAVDLVLVPGVGFSRDGSRIGHGVGYYDRYFARCFAAAHDPVRIGLAHDLQIVDLPDPEPWDVAMHVVICPTEIVIIGDQ